MELPRTYTELAKYWTLISDPADYAEEAALWRQVLRSRLGPGRHQILELGVGGGNNLSHLTGEFDAVAADLSPQMIEQARKINPGVEFHVADMRSIRLHRKFRAVLIHDAISYMLTEHDLRAAFTSAAAHLEPGGVFVTAPDWTRETFRDPFVEHSTRAGEGVTLTHLSYTYDPDTSDTTVEALCWYIIREGGDLRIEEDRHRLGLFSLDRWLDLMAQAGFEAEPVACNWEDDPRQAYLLAGVLR